MTSPQIHQQSTGKEEIQKPQAKTIGVVRVLTAPIRAVNACLQKAFKCIKDCFSLIFKKLFQVMKRKKIQKEEVIFIQALPRGGNEAQNLLYSVGYPSGFLLIQVTEFHKNIIQCEQCFGACYQQAVQESHDSSIPVVDILKDDFKGLGVQPFSATVVDKLLSRNFLIRMSKRDLSYLGNYKSLSKEQLKKKLTKILKELQENAKQGKRDFFSFYSSFSENERLSILQAALIYVDVQSNQPTQSCLIGRELGLPFFIKQSF